MASTEAVRGIGNGTPPGYKLVRESAPLPPTRDLVLLEVQRVLNLGLVQVLRVEVGEPITWLRLVKDTDETLDPMVSEILDQDIYPKVRNADVEDFPFHGPFLETLCVAFQSAVERSLRVTTILAHSNKILAALLPSFGPAESAELFGVPVVYHLEVPDDIVLVVLSAGDPTEVALALRIPIDLPAVPKAPAKRTK
jgi:hypothetical protein